MTVVKEAYIKKRRTLLTFIPNESASLVQTAKPYFSKKCRNEIKRFKYLLNFMSVLKN